MCTRRAQAVALSGAKREIFIYTPRKWSIIEYIRKCLPPLDIAITGVNYVTLTVVGIGASEALLISASRSERRDGLAGPGRRARAAGGQFALTAKTLKATLTCLLS